jgi:hypothetical protein
MRTLIFLILFFSSTALAKPPLPPEQWTPRAHVWLARAVVAEADWLAKKDHTLIAWALTYRWRAIVRRWPTMRFVDVVRNYCAGLGDLKRSPTPRQLWLRALPLQVEREHWPKRLPWRHAERWKKVLHHIHTWSKGRVRDPSKGRVRHWGGNLEIDNERAQKAISEGRWVELDLGDTANTFYGYAPRLPVEVTMR